MPRLCPVCEKNRMWLGGYVVDDGAICGKCYNRLVAKGLQYTIKKMKINDIRNILEAGNAANATPEAYDAVLIEREKFASQFEPVAENFRKNYQKFFEAKGIPENHALQGNVTQFLWHTLMLKKKRLDRLNLYQNSELVRSAIPGTKAIEGEKSFDGKYEIATAKEQIMGTNIYYKDGVALYKEKRPDVARFRIINAKREGKKTIICPNCGAFSTREALLDGCDYCGTKFKVEDLGMRISDFSIEKDTSVEAERYFRKDINRKVFSKIWKVCYVLILVISLISILIGEEDVSELPMLIIGGLIAALFFAVPAFFIYVMLIRPIRWSAMTSRADAESGERAVNEYGRRAGLVINDIHAYDPLFSVEGFYSEVGNILANLHFAEHAPEVSVFFDNPDERTIKDMILNNINVIDFRLNNIRITGYRVDDDLQHIEAVAECETLSYDQKAFRKKEKKLKLHLVKDANCKTQAICAPTFLKCQNCGSSLSLMEGAHCEHCGNDGKLRHVAWAIAEME